MHSKKLNSPNFEGDTDFPNFNLALLIAKYWNCGQVFLSGTKIGIVWWEGEIWKCQSLKWNLENFL